MESSGLGWVQQTLLDRFQDRAEAVAIRDCTCDAHQEYSYRELAGKVNSISQQLTDYYGERALLLLPGNAYFVFGLLACAISGVTAVPVNLPGTQRLNRVKIMLEHILNDCEPQVVLALSSSKAELNKMGWHRNRKVIYLDEIEDSVGEINTDVLKAAHGPILLQYSSGSTGMPKAVCNYDDNISHHHQLMEEMHSTLDHIHTANWLPFYHDLGLFYGLLYPLFSGGSCSFIYPSQFVKNPFDWLALIDQYQANIIMAPDFAYKLCVDAIPAQNVARLDLSSLVNVLTAAEPIRPSTLDAFVDHFRPAGFLPKMYMTGYGMAEATLVVSYQAKGTPLVRKQFDEKSLAVGLAIEVQNGRELVSSGNCIGSWELKIVDPETLSECENKQIGEVWVTGKCLSKGYWNKPELTCDIFHAQLAGNLDNKRYLRTGDSAFIFDGELFIFGRLKDVIIVAGENHMPNDIEASIETHCELVGIGGACFVQDIESGKIYGICEVHRHTVLHRLELLTEDICALVLAHHQLVVEQVILVAKYGLKKTSSGKICRNQMLNDWKKKQIKSLFISKRQPHQKEDSCLKKDEDFVFCSLKALIGCNVIDELQGFADLGVTSIVAMQWCAQLAEHYQLSLSPTILFAYPNLKSLREWLLTQTSRQLSPPCQPETNHAQVAIVAVSCRLPQQKTSSWREYANWLAKGESAVTELDSSLRAFSLPVGAIDDIDKFDAPFFGISNNEARLMDPQQRWLLESGWHLFEQAGWFPEQQKGQQLGIFIGQGSQDYGNYLAQLNDDNHAKSYLVTGNSSSASSGRLAKFFGTRGPAITIDTACSSSLVAIDMAVDYIRFGRGATAIAGGVNCLLSSQTEQALINAQMLSPNGRCATFSHDADGYVRAEGLGLLLLKNYQSALDDGDPILAVIEASGVAQDGESSSLTAPNPLAQQALLQQVLDQSGASIDDVDAIELHGTGTPLGDPVELSAVDSVYGMRQAPLHLTAAKSQLGHLESASGVAGVIRAIAQMQQQTLFAHPTFDQPNPHLEPWLSRYRFSQQAQSLHLRRMAVSSMGFTGTLAHLILRHEPNHTLEPLIQQHKTAGGVRYLPMAAFDQAALKRLALQWVRTLQQHSQEGDVLLDAWLCKRSHTLPARACTAYQNIAQLIGKLERFGSVTPEQQLPLPIQAWIDGSQYDWSVHAESDSFALETLCDLPLYPFAKEQYWVESSQTLKQTVTTVLDPQPDFDSERFLRDWIGETLAINADEVGDEVDLISLGIDSLQMMDLVDEAKKVGVGLELARMYETPTLQAWLKLFTQRSGAAGIFNLAKKPILGLEKEEQLLLSEPFELTGVQQAYWQGRKSDQVMGGVACQVYLELNRPQLDYERLNCALVALTRRHSMLRMRMQSDGRGIIADHPAMRITEYHWQALSDSEAFAKQERLRSKLQALVLDLENQSGLAIGVSHTAQGSRLHINIDMVIADALSIHILLQDLAQFYAQPQLTEAPVPTEHFPCYLHHLAVQNTQNDARQYWLGQIHELPGAPDLPIVKRPEAIDVPKFVHRDWRLSKHSWQDLQVTCRHYGITPSMILATCYAETLRGWSNNQEFCLNLTIFNRRFDAFDISDMVADFTTLMLLACKKSVTGSILDNARRLNQTFMANLDHKDYDAVNVLKEMSCHAGAQITMPVVFTSNLGHDFLSDNVLGTPDYIVSQTPQVWIDCQVMEQNGELIVSWDAVDELFPEQMLDQMFDFMGCLISRLAEQPELFNQPVDKYLNAQQQQVRYQRNKPQETELQHRTLHGRFFELVQQYPDNIAVIDATGQLSYQQLADQAESLAAELYHRGVCVGDRVAILLLKSQSQVVAVLATHLLGAAYVPLDTEQPIQRLLQIINQAEPRCVIVDEHSQELLLGNDMIASESLVNVSDRHVLISKEISWPRFLPGQAAYIIYTSGSTGVPKGVITTHQAAANTIDDINYRVNMNMTDRVFALSALNFDLSVFDIFAPLSIGGALVIPDTLLRREAKSWLRTIAEYKVTIWNSVPALFDMLLITAENSDISMLPDSLKYALLSGDWVGLDLHPRLNTLSTSIRLMALGGATEAAIWSNCFDIEEIKPQWNSVPYGYSLSHQHYRVMDKNGRDCPDWVTGELWIGGEGLAEGYFNDPQKTVEQFVIHEGQKYYRTGDMGRFWPDGIIEFIGRRDNQVKIRGYRIELGEIEHSVRQYQGVQKAVALVAEQPSRHIQLFVETEADLFSCARDSEENLSASLPLPIKWHPIDDSSKVELEISAYIADQVLNRLLQRGVGSKNTLLSKEEWYCTLSICDRFEDVVSYWLDLLVDSQRWQENDGYYGSEDNRVTSLESRLPSENIAPSYRILLMAMENRVDWYADVLQGDACELELLDDPDLTPEVLVLNHPELPQAVCYLCEYITQLSSQLGRPVKVVELNGREGRLASAVLTHCDPDNVRYWVTESAASMRDKARYRLSGFGEHAEVLTLHECESLNADLVISNNALHRFANVHTGIDTLADLLAPAGHFVVLETQRLSPLAWLTVCLLQPELFTARHEAFNDRRIGSAMPLMSAAAWEECLNFSSLETKQNLVSGSRDLVMIIGRQAEKVLVENTQELKNWLEQNLPAYMVPQCISVCKSIPLTANGKVDRKKLLAFQQPLNDIEAEADNECQTENERLVAEIWQSVLGGTVNRSSNFFQLGGDSLHATRIVVALDEAGTSDIKLSDIFNRPVLQEFAQYIKRNKSEQKVCVQLMHNDDDLYQPFVLTDVQQAYITGRKDGLVMGGVGTHFYSEFETDQLDILRLERALMQVIARHHTLRIVFDNSGTQRFLPEAPYCPLNVIKCDDASWDDTRSRMRTDLSHKVLELTQWPLFHFTLIVSDQGHKRLCIGLDNVILDGLSMRILFAELGMLYRDPDALLPPLGITFKDYQDQVYTKLSPEKQQKSRDYWESRLPTLPDAPRLPLSKEPNQLAKPRFVRRQSVLARDKWQKLVAKAREHGITPSCLLLNCYAKILAHWSENSALSINVTLFDRKSVHENIHHIMGDFTSLLLLETVQHSGESWLTSTQRLQQRLWQDLEHADISAVWVMRELAKLKQVSDVSMPVVFTSALGADTALDESSILNPVNSVWGVSQTPQVWIDHQVFEYDGALHFNWDVVEELFPQGMMNAMFVAYCALLEELVEHDWNQSCAIKLPHQQRAVRDQVNQTHAAKPEQALHMAVYQQMLARPEQIAVVLGDQSISYLELYQRVSQCAADLHQYDIQPAECVGLMLPRSVEQIVAVLAIQWIGAAYVPIAVDWPDTRVESILKQASISKVICQAKHSLPHDIVGVVMNHFVSNAVQLLTPVERQADDIAYVIFTSGSTGEPKGVAIAHGAAMNTINAINRQHNVTCRDSVLALSALYFDLSVYDIFGLLAAGGKLVLLHDEQYRDVAVYLQLVQQQRVTLWNSVPALLEMALLRATPQEMASLRCVMLSGDWISLELPYKLERCNPQAKLVAMGGATEASIWSNYWLVDKLEPDWKSIPYGFPLLNQAFRVVNESGGDCPDWVAGELWIGGDGVALGYIGNEALTEQQFCWYQGERWYRTGDLGRYCQDGRLEFLGRKDQQVKIAGLRIELDEISQALRRCSSVEEAVVMVKPNLTRPKIHAYLLASETLDFADIEQTLRSYLPVYSMPDGYVVLDQWPLTVNGKIDRKQLSKMDVTQAQSTEFVTATTPVQCLLIEALAQVLKRSEPISVNDNFFAIGGDSFVAIQLTALLEKQHGIELPLQSVFNLQTISQIAQAIEIPTQTPPQFEYEEGSI